VSVSVLSFSQFEILYTYFSSYHVPVCDRIRKARNPY